MVPLTVQLPDQYAIGHGHILSTAHQDEVSTKQSVPITDRIINNPN